MPRIRISEAEATRDFAAVMTRVREGAESSSKMARCLLR